MRLLVAAYESFYVVLFGSMIASFSQAFMANPVAKMATTWFGDKEVNLNNINDALERFSHCIWKYGNAFGMSSEFPFPQFILQ